MDFTGAYRDGVCVCVLTEISGEVMTEVSVEFCAVSFFQTSAQPKVRQLDMALHHTDTMY